MVYRKLDFHQSFTLRDSIYWLLNVMLYVEFTKPYYLRKQFEKSILIAILVLFQLLFNKVYFIVLVVVPFVLKIEHLYNFLSFSDFNMVQQKTYCTSTQHATSAKVSQKLHIICSCNPRVQSFPKSRALMLYGGITSQELSIFCFFCDICVPYFQVIHHFGKLILIALN